jgi:hypothetical protein
LITEQTGAGASIKFCSVFKLMWDNFEVNFIAVDTTLEIAFNGRYEPKDLELGYPAAVDETVTSSCTVSAARCNLTQLGPSALVLGGDPLSVCFTSVDYHSRGCKIVGIESLQLILATGNATGNVGTSKHLILDGAPLTLANSSTQQYYSDTFATCNGTEVGECAYLNIRLWSLFVDAADLEVVGIAYMDLAGDGNNRTSVRRSVKNNRTSVRRSVKANMHRLLERNEVGRPIAGYINADEWPEQSGAAVIFGAFATLAAVVGAAGLLMI